MVSKMKHILLTSLFLLFAGSFLFADEKNLTLTLEYEIPNGVDTVFSEDCSLALCVEEIRADGKVLSHFDDIRIIPVCAVGYTAPAGKIGKMKMEWEKIGSNFVWNDGRGILFSKSESGFFIPKTNSYMLPIGTKNLEIRYKVLLPTPDIEADSLLKSFPENGCYTPTYRYQMRVESILKNGR